MIGIKNRYHFTDGFLRVEQAGMTPVERLDYPRSIEDSVSWRSVDERRLSPAS